MVLGSTQPLNRDIFWGVKVAVRRADNLTIFVCWLSRNPGSLNLLEPYGSFQTSNGVTLTLQSQSSHLRHASKICSHKTVQTNLDSPGSYSPEGTSPVGIGCTYGTLHMSIQGSPVEVQTPATGTWSPAARPARCLCYCPAVSFRHFRVTALLSGALFCYFIILL